MCFRRRMHERHSRVNEQNRNNNIDLQYSAIASAFRSSLRRLLTSYDWHLPRIAFRCVFSWFCIAEALKVVEVRWSPSWSRFSIPAVMMAVYCLLRSVREVRRVWSLVVTTPSLRPSLLPTGARSSWKTFGLRSISVRPEAYLP